VSTETTGWSAECAQPSSFHAARFCHIVANLVVDFVVFDVEHRGVGLDALKGEFALSRAPALRRSVPTSGLHSHLIATGT
jgi:hypothetical protein